MSFRAKERIYLVLFVVLLLLPLAIMLLAPHPSGRQWWRDGAVALGFLGLSLMGWQFVSPVRLRFLTEAIDLDTLYRIHHMLSRLAFFLVLAHPLILVLGNPYNFVAFNLLSGAWKLMAGTLAFGLMALLVVTSIWREWLRLSYEIWHILHDLLAAAVLGFALYHILTVGYYTALPLQRWLWILYAIIWFAMILYIRVIKPLRLLRHPWALVDVIEERGATWTLVFEPEDHHGMQFRAGQAAWLTIDASPFGLSAHPFSFSSSALQPERLSFTVRELGDWTAGVGKLALGTRAYIDGPYGTFDLDHHPSSEYVFIAGGIGAAPIMGILRTLAERGDTRRLHFFYGNRTWDSVTYREDLEELQEKLNLEMIHVLEKPPEGWQGETGFITVEVLSHHLPEDVACVYFLCGPLPMIYFVTKALRQIGVPESHIYVEQYEMA